MVIVFLALLSISGVFARRGFGPTEQEWGFVTVREGAHMFWWLHQTAANVHHYAERPLVVWLQGGPGGSSTAFGNFVEIGPLDENLKPRNTTWVRNYNVLFVDNPVGTGYSHVSSPNYLTTSNREIAEDFLQFLKGFYGTLPELKAAPLYIFAESYGGKMAAEIALVVDQAVKDGALNVRLLGVGLGDAWISPIDFVMTWAPYLLNLGIVDQAGYQLVEASANLTQEAYNNRNYRLAAYYWARTESVIQNVTALVDFYNVLTKISTDKIQRSVFHPSSLPDDHTIADLMNKNVAKMLGLNVLWGDQNGEVFKALYGDFMKPVTEIVELLLNTTDIKVAIYNGQLDLIVDTPGTVKWVDNLKFRGGENWPSETRHPMERDSVIEGYYKKAGNLAMYWVVRAGHMVPADNPAAMEFILEDVIERQFSNQDNFV